MTNFYNNLDKSMGKADALAEAKRTFRKEHPNASPFYWAPFILIGDNEPVYIEKKSNLVFWLVGGFLVIVAVIFTLRRGRYKSMRKSF